MRIELLSTLPSNPDNQDADATSLMAVPDGRRYRARSGDIRLDLPDHVVDRLLERANVAGQSLEWYVNTELTKLASRPNADELLERIRCAA